MKRTKKDISHVIAHEYCGIKWAYVVFFHDGNILYPVKYMHMNCHREYTKLPKYIKEFIQDAELASVETHFNGTTIIKRYARKETA